VVWPDLLALTAIGLLFFAIALMRFRKSRRPETMLRQPHGWLVIARPKARSPVTQRL
jgi:hypothetical protein